MPMHGITATDVGNSLVMTNTVAGGAPNDKFWFGTGGSFKQVGYLAYKPGGGSWTSSSDARLKKNIEDFTLGLETLAGMRPRKFDYIDQTYALRDQDGNIKKYVGAVAQEMLEVYPNAVNIGPDGYYSLDPSDFVFMLINAVKELKARVEALEAR